MGLFFTPLDLILSSRSKLRLLRALHGTHAPVSGREAAAAAGVAVQPAQRALADLVALGVVHRDDTRSQHLYTLNRESVLVQGALEPLFQAEAARVGTVFREVAEMLDGTAAKHVAGVYLFGSAARGKDRSGSDFDVLTVVTSRQHVDTTHEALAQSADALYTRHGLRLSVVVLDLPKLRKMHGKGDALVKEVLRDNRRITGTRLEELLHGQTGRQKAG